MVNPKKELFVWGPIEFRLLYGAFFIEDIWVEMPKRSPWPWAEFVTLFENGRATFIGEDKILRDAGEEYFKKYFLNARNYDAHWKKWEAWLGDFIQFQKRAPDSFRGLSDPAMVQWYKEFRTLYTRFWLIVHIPEIANWGGERMLVDELTRRDPERAHQHLEILSAPIEFSYFQEEELALLRLAPLRGNALEQALAAHAVQYHWILNSYGGNRVLGAKFFADKLKELMKKGRAEKQVKSIERQREAHRLQKRKLEQQLKLSPAVMRMADQLSRSIWWQDLRKAYIWKMHDLLDLFLKELVGRNAWKFDDLLWCWPEEVLRIAQGRFVNRKLINARKGLYALYLDNKRIHEYYGNSAKKFIAQYKKSANTTTQEVKGLVVSRGRGEVIRGVARTILDPFRDGKKMKKGDVLIASMTSPEFIIAMKKASAIVTDAGGMTSHAAIVSRELQIPCIVGTKIATQVFRDGDRVEVDAEKGVVRKI